MTTADLNALRTDLATRSKWNIGYFVAGLLFWVYVTAVAFLLPLAAARFYWLAGTFVIFPVAVFVSWLLRADPFSKGNALGELVGYTHMSVAAMTFPLVMLAPTAGLYLLLSAATFIAYAADKAAAAKGSWRTPESTLHALAVAGGWPGALLAQQFLRHKSTKPEFRQVFWFTVLLNVLGLVVLASPIRHSLLPAP